MKKLIAIVLTVVSINVLTAEERSLPKPASKSGVDVISAIESRKSFRNFTGKPIPEKDLSTILWSALGITWRAGAKSSISGVDAITGATTGERRATVFAFEQTITAYVLLAEGAFRYEPVKNALIKVSSVDLRDSATSQKFPGRASVIILVADGKTLDRITGQKEDKLAWVNTCAGLAAQNVYLTTTTLGYGTVLIWYVDKRSLPSVLGLSDKDHVLYALPLGSVN